MIRTQIQLTEEQADRLKAMAIEQGVSIAEIVRRSIDLYVHEQVPLRLEERRQRAMSVVGKYASGQSDIGTEHDRYLADVYKGQET